MKNNNYYTEEEKKQRFNFIPFVSPLTHRVYIIYKNGATCSSPANFQTDKEAIITAKEYAEDLTREIPVEKVIVLKYDKNGACDNAIYEGIPKEKPQEINPTPTNQKPQHPTIKKTEEPTDQTGNEKMNNLIIVSKSNNDLFTSCKPEQVQVEIENAKEFYSRDIRVCKSHLINYPNMADHWEREIKRLTAILAAGFEAVTWEEYQKREAEKLLSKTATECTAEEYNNQLNILPPLNYINMGTYTIFHLSEALSMTYHTQYIHIHGTNKYYCATTDLYDRATWIDKLLGLRK